MRVRDGRVQKKNNWSCDRRNLTAVAPRDVAVERRKPGEGYRHVMTVSDLRTFLELLPAWDELAVGLRAIVLGGEEACDDCMGWYGSPVLIGICAWDHDLWWDIIEESWLDEHRLVLELLNVDRRLLSEEEERELLGPFAGSFDDRSFELRWTAGQARAFQLLHIAAVRADAHRRALHLTSPTQAVRRAASGGVGGWRRPGAGCDAGVRQADAACIREVSSARAALAPTALGFDDGAQAPAGVRHSPARIQCEPLCTQTRSSERRRTVSCARIRGRLARTLTATAKGDACPTCRASRADPLRD